MTDEPEVLTWMIALAPRPRHLVGRHWWRELVQTTLRSAHDQWVRDAEVASNGWATELEEFRAENPPPTLRSVLVGLSQGSIAP